MFLNFLKFLESIRLPFFDWLFSLITHIGEETVFMATALIIFWCISKKYGYYILTVGFVGTILNQFLKLVFRIPRPWVKDPDFSIVESARKEATGYSFPSGHTQNAVGTFGCISYISRYKWLKIVSVVLCILVPFSRMYLGVHTPIDVGVSVLIALVLIYAIRPIIEKSERNPYIMYIFLGALFVLSIAFILFAELYGFPPGTDENNLSSGVKNAYTLFGAISGLIIAYPIEKRYVRFDTSGKWYVQILKLVIGLLLIVGIKSILKAPLDFIFASHPAAHSLRYAIIVIFAVLVWPLTFPLFNRLSKKS